MAGGRTTGRPAWLQNMSVPARSVLTCARATVRGVRFHVSVLPGGYSRDEEAWWLAEMHGCLQRHGMAALAALTEAVGAGSECGPRWVEKTASRWKGDAAAHALDELKKALRPIRLPPGVGVFAPERPSGPRPPRLDNLAALALLARRAGPLYVPARPVEPSLIVLAPAVLIFPAAPAGDGHDGR